MTFVATAVRRAAAFVDRWDWVWLICAAPFLLFPSVGRSPALLVVPAVWLAGLVARRPLTTRTPLNCALLVMFVMVLVSEWATYDIAVSLPKIGGLVLGVGVFFALVRLGESPRGWWVACGVFGFVGLGIAGLGLIATNFGTKIAALAPITTRLTPRLSGLPGAEPGFSANELAGALVWVAPLLLMLTVAAARWRRGRSRLVTLALALGTGVVCGVLVLTQSRGGYLGFCVSLVFMLLLGVPRRWRAAVLVVILVVSALGVGLALTQPDRLAALFSSQNPTDATDPGAMIESANGRVEVWSRAIYGIQDFPFTGMGLNTFRRVVTVLYPFFLFAPDMDIGHAHNEFLQAALDLGIPGLIAFIAIYLIAFWMLLEIWRTAPGTPAPALLRALALGLGGGLFAHIVYGLTDAVALGAKAGLMYWMLLGLIVGLHRQSETRVAG